MIILILIIMFCGLGEVRLLEKEPYSVGEEALGDFGIYWRETYGWSRD